MYKSRLTIFLLVLRMFLVSRVLAMGVHKGQNRAR